jgi:fluoroquinolone transport system ATP-binding protein
MIAINNLNFSYTKKPFIQNINFNVEKGEIFGFLGPSGAGKSTIQKILIGMITNYSGSVVVNNVEVKNHTNQFYEKIGVDFEYPSLYEKLTAKENLDFFSSLYKNSIRNHDELLSSVGLLQDENKKVSAFSKGMKSRLNFIKSLVNNPEILFLDEPTSGLDPTNAKLMKDLILEQKRKGVTVIITTHNMQDATELCDKVAFIVDGKIKLMDSPHNLIMKKVGGIINYSYSDSGIEKKGSCDIKNCSKDAILNKAILENRILTIHSEEQNLGDIFIEVTGRKLS